MCPRFLKSILACCPLFFAYLGMTTGENQDSLRNVIKHEKSLEEKVDAVFKLRDIYKNTNNDSALVYGKLALDLSLGNNDSLAIKAYAKLAHTTYMSSDFEACYDYTSKGILLAKENNIDYYLSHFYNVNGNAMQEQGLYNEAMENLLKSKDLAEIKKDSYALARANVNLSYIYYRIKDYDKVFENTNEAISIAKLNNYNNVLLFGYNMLGGAFESTENYDESLKYYKIAYGIADSLNSTIQKATTLQNIAGEYARRKNYNEAIKAFNEAIVLFEGIDDLRGKNEVMGSLGELYLRKKNFSKALEFCQQAYNYSKENKILHEQEVNSECLYHAYKNLGDINKALIYHEEFKLHSDSISSSERKSELTSIELNHKFDKEKEQLRIQQFEKELLLNEKNKRFFSLSVFFSLIALAGLLSYLWVHRKNKLIEKQKLELEQINATKDKLFAIIGHDLKRPAIAMKGISSKVKYLLDNKDYQRLELFGEQIEQNASAFNKLVNNLLHWALLQKDVMPYKPKHISVDNLTKALFDLYQSESQSKDIKLKSNVDEKTWVFADEIALNAIISNLLDNAIKFTQVGGEISINAHQENGKTNIQIIDKGQGMSPNQLTNIFDLRKGKTNIGTKGESGTGLGLHLVSELVQLNKGKISVESIPTKGTTFNISLPNQAI